MAVARGPRNGVCSARGCQKPALWAIIWRNPSIRRNRDKTWLACDEHREYLLSYMRVRDFPAHVMPAAEVDIASRD